MGFYLDVSPQGKQLTADRKAEELISLAGERRCAPGHPWHPDLVVVLHNGPFDAALHCVDPAERESLLGDRRPMTWLLVPNASALSGFRNSALAKRWALDPVHLGVMFRAHNDAAAIERHLGVDFLPAWRTEVSR